MAVSKEDFLKVWKDSSREDILNQYYYDYEFTRELCDKVNKAIEYINKYGRECGNGEQYFTTSTPVTYLLDILKESDDDDNS